MHLTEYQIAKYINDKLSDDEKRELEEHLSESPNCMNSLVSAYQMIKTVEKSDDVQADPEMLRKARNLVIDSPGREYNIPIAGIRLAGVFTVLLTVAAIFYFVFSGGSEPDRFRAAENPDFVELLQPAENSFIRQQMVQLTWQEIEGVRQYTILIYEEDGTQIAGFHSETNTAEISGEDHFSAGKRFLWKVRGIYEDGSVVESDMGVFTYLPDGLR